MVIFPASYFTRGYISFDEQAAVRILLPQKKHGTPADRLRAVNRDALDELGGKLLGPVLSEGCTWVSCFIESLTLPTCRFGREKSFQRKIHVNFFQILVN